MPKISVTLKEPWGGYNSGESVLLRDKQAKRLIRRGAAIYTKKETEEAEKLKEAVKEVEAPEEYPNLADERGENLKALSVEQLKVIAKKAGVDHWWTKGRDTLLEDLHDLGYIANLPIGSED